MNILKIKTPERILGNYGEKAACKYLRRHGYKILKKNFTADSAEIDIIAQNSDTLIFVEVKTRSINDISEISFEISAAKAVNKDKIRRTFDAAKAYILENPSTKQLRFDVIEVYLKKDDPKKILDINHIENAF